MRMSDTERLDLMARLLEESSILIRDLCEEVGQYREIDGRENDLLADIEEVLGRGLRDGR